MLTFSPLWDLDTHQFANDAAGDICVPLIWSPCVKPEDRELGMWRCVLDDATLIEWTGACREVVKLPLASMYWFVANETLAQLEAAVGVRRKKWRPAREEWRDSDLIAEVEAVAGQGKQHGDEWWFRCPFHDEKTPSLHVNGKKHTWKCFGCQKQGGHVAWRRAVEQLGRRSQT